MLYSTLISNIENNPTSQIYFEKMFPNKPIKWDEIYLVPHKVTYNTYLLNNILYFNNKLHTSKFTNSPLCSFCKHENKTTLHIFYSCKSTLYLWSQFKLFLEPNLILPPLLPQTAIFSFLDDSDNQHFVLLNHLMLVFKLNVYNSRRDKVLINR